MGVPLVMSIDIGSTAVKVIAISPEGKLVASASGRYPTNSPQPGWVEQNPKDWWTATSAAVRECVMRAGAGDIRAVSFSGHMSAPVLLDRDGGSVLPSILIGDARSAEETKFLRESYRDVFVSLTGNEPVDAFTVSKLLWIKRHHPEALNRAAVLLFPKDYIRYKLTGTLATDPTDAGNSLLFDAVKSDWAFGLIGELGLAPALFPPIRDSHAVVGGVGDEAAALTGLRPGTPVVTGAADMACSQLGTSAVRPGTLAVTLSTSAQVVMRVEAVSPAAAGRITFHPSAVPGTLYAMGSIFTGGLGIDWAYRLMTGKEKLDASDFEAIGGLSERMEDMQPGSGGLMFLPFLIGSGSPYFDSRDRASWLGLSTGQKPELLLHSVMEGVAYNIRESMALFEAEGHAIDTVHLGGGGSRNPVWGRMIGDVLGKDISLLSNRDASAVGAAMLAGVGCGLYDSAADAARAIVKTAPPQPHSPDRHRAYDRIYARYLKAYRALNEFYRDEQ